MAAAFGAVGLALGPAVAITLQRNIGNLVREPESFGRTLTLLALAEDPLIFALVVALQVMGRLRVAAATTPDLGLLGTASRSLLGWAAIALGHGFLARMSGAPPGSGYAGASSAAVP